MNYKIIGNKNKLFSMHGMVEADRTLDALANLSESYELDIDKINNASEKAGIYVTESGRILSEFTGNDERRAKYKIVPTGLFQKYTEYPLLASFIKSQGFWEGPFIGTATQLFEMYKQHTKKDSFCEDYKQYFSGSCRVLDLVGFGLNELKEARNNMEGALENQNKIFEDDKDSKDDSLAKALEKALEGIILKDHDDESSGHSSKEKRKKQRLEQTLEKVKKAEEKKEKQEQEKVEKEIENAAKALENNENESDDINIDTDTQEDEEEVILEMDHDFENNKVQQEKYKYKMQLKRDLIEDIYERLLIKENWKATDKNRLGFYLKGLMLLIHKRQRDLSKDNIKGNGYTFSDNRNRMVVNTGLLDNFGNYIYLIDHTPPFASFYDKKVSIMNNKAELLNFGFSIENIRHMPDPIKIVEDVRDLIFEGDIEDFDFNDTIHMSHIIKERIDRFPKKYRTESEVIINNKIRTAIEQAVRISKTDHTYMVPKYDFKRDTIQFLVPLHLDTSADETPELTLVIDRQNGIWVLYTVLYSDDAYDDARLVCRPTNTWISTINIKSTKSNK